MKKGDMNMKKMEETRQELQEKIEWKKRYIAHLMENIADYGNKAFSEMQEDNSSWAFEYIETIESWTREIQNERQEITNLYQQIRLIDYLMKEGE